MTLNNLGNAYGDLGDYQKQKDFLERCLKIKEQHYGAEHPEVAMTLNNLGNNIREARGLPEAEGLSGALPDNRGAALRCRAPGGGHDP